MAYVKENKERMSEVFTAIANAVAQDLPSDWTNVCVGYLVDSSSHSEMLVYVSADNGANWSDFMDVVFSSDDILEGVFDCKEHCEKLYGMCCQSGDKWTEFALRVNALGEFTADFGYDNFDEITARRKSSWRGKYLY